MFIIAAICFLVLIAIGIWFYYSCYPRPPVVESREIPEVKLLKTASSLNPKLEKYLKGLDTPQAAEVLAANSQDISAGLWAEVEAMYLKMDRAGEFLDLLENPRQEIRAQGAEVLGYMNVPGGGESLAAALGDKGEEVRLAAVEALVRLGDPSIAPLLAKALGSPGRLLPARVAEVLISLGKEAVEPLLEEVNNAGEEGQCLICEVLGQLADQRALPVLKGLLGSSPFSQVRACAAEALGSTPGGDNETVRALTAALGDEAWEVRARAAKALGQRGNQESAPALADAAANDEDWNVRTIAEAALSSLSQRKASQ